MLPRPIRLLPLLLAAACASGSSATPAAPASEIETARRFCAILDYVAADYAGAVKDGQVLDDAEYKEQLAFIKDAGELAKKLPSGSVDTGARLREVGDLIAAKAGAEQVAALARELRRQVLEANGIVLAPTSPPSRDVASRLFAQSCAPCHGATGAGDGPAGLQLKPRPRSFLDAETMADLSPSRAFNALTDGVKGTPMPSFGAFSASERWSLAFYVFGLRHGADAVERGTRAYERAQRAVAATPTRLAGLSDAELERLLGTAGLDEPARRDALAYLRGAAPYQTRGAALDEARALLATALASYRSGDAGAARQAAGAAYLDGFEPHEDALRTRDASLVVDIEERFLAVRDQIGGGAPVDAVEREALQLGALLDKAEETLAGHGGARVAFVSSLIVILREGLEAALLIMLLLGMARRDEQLAAAQVRAVHVGWLAAAGVGVATWFASEPLMRLGGARRELVEGVVALIAAGALLAAGHFVLARLDAKRRVDALKRRLAAAGSSSRRNWVLAGLAFVAIYREAFEVVLFLRAIALDAGRSSAAVAGGAALGAILLIGLVALLGRLGRRLKTGPLLAAMGTLLCVLAVVLSGKGVRALQEAGVLGIWPLSLPRIDWLGLFPSLQGLVAQLVVLIAFAVIAAVALMRSRRLGVSSA